MEFSFAFGGEPLDLTIKVSGVANPLDVQRLNDALVADLRYKPGLTILLDLSELDTSQLTDEGLQLVSEPSVERDLNFPPLAVAIVAPDARTFADARLYRAHLGGSVSRRSIFASREDALVWLREQRERPTHSSAASQATCA